MIVTRHQPTLSPQVHQYQQQQRQHYPGELVEGNYTDEIESDGIDAEVPHVPPFANGDDLKLACRLWHNSCCCCCCCCYHHHASSSCSRGPTDATCAVWRRAFPHCQETMWQPLHHRPRRLWTMQLSVKLKLNQPPLQLKLLVGDVKWLQTWTIAHHAAPAVDLVCQRQREASSPPPLLPPMQRLHHSHLHQHSRRHRCPLLPLELQQTHHPAREPPQLMRSPPDWQQIRLGPWWRHRLVARRRRLRSGC